MKAVIFAIGTELLGHTYLDTNSLAITRSLERYGVTLCRKYVLPDDETIIAEELRDALSRHDIVITSGGLGPTMDDLTKKVISDVLAIPLREDDRILEHIRKLFSDRDMEMPEVNRKQALVFPGQRTLFNRGGTAPGFHLNVNWDNRPKHVWVLPGVPNELLAMVDGELDPWLRSASVSTIHRRTVRVVGLTESAVEEKLLPFYDRHHDDAITVLASRGEIQVHLRADGAADDAYPKLIQMEKELRDIFGERVFGLDDETLEQVVGRQLASRGETVSTAESCTGGLLASRITDISGSSAYFLGGAVAYSGDAKLFLVGVDPKLIEEHGEVSEEVARDMASGVRRRFNTTWGIGITGIAGPTGGTAKKPVGTVHLAVADRHGSHHRKYLFVGSREMVKFYSTQMALDLLRLTM